MDDDAQKIIPAAFPELKRLAWNRDSARPIDLEDAFSLYDRNWRFIDTDHLTAREAALIDRLERAFGGGFRFS